MALKLILFIAIIVGASGMAVNTTVPVITGATPNLRKETIAECTLLYNISQDAIENILNRVGVSADPDIKYCLPCYKNRIRMMKGGKMDNLTKMGCTDECDIAKIDKIMRLCKYESKIHCQLYPMTLVMLVMLGILFIGVTEKSWVIKKANRPIILIV